MNDRGHSSAVVVVRPGLVRRTTPERATRARATADEVRAVLDSVQDVRESRRLLADCIRAETRRGGSRTLF